MFLGSSDFIHFETVVGSLNTIPEFLVGTLVQISNFRRRTPLAVVSPHFRVRGSDLASALLTHISVFARLPRFVDLFVTSTALQLGIDPAV